jgi:hypothetical protein
MKVGGFFIGAEAVLLNTVTLGCERYRLISIVTSSLGLPYHDLGQCFEGQYWSRSSMRVLRGFAAFAFVLLGACITFFSGAVAFGWGHRPLSVAATIVALIGYVVVFAGYRLVRDSDWEFVASAFMKGLLLLGCALLIPPVIAMAIHVQADFFPYAYFILTGCLSAIGYVRFRKHATR